VQDSPRAFVGRSQVLAALRAAVDAATGGVPQLVLLTGEPGIGKTALAGQATAHAAASGARIAWGAGWDGDGVPAFWPWRQVLRALGNDLESTDAASDTTPNDARFRLFASVADALEAASAPAGLVVVLDDLHWADAGTLRLLAFVARHLRSARLLLLATFRDVDPSLTGELSELLADVAAEAATFTLSGLGEAEVTALLSGLVGSVPADVATAVFRRTGGNPLFVHETGRMLAIDGPAGLAAVPVAVRDTIGRRLGRLPAGVHETLASASVLGPQFAADVLAEVCDREPAAVTADLEVAEHERIMTQLDGAVRFAHDLFRETLAGGLDAATRRRLHRRAGDALRRRGASSAALVYHYAGALPDVEPDLVVKLAREAARAATANVAYEEAVRHLRLAVRLAGHEDLFVELGDAARRLGDSAEARSAYERAARSDDPPVVARAALGLHYLGTSSEASHAAVIGLLERSVAVLSAEAPSALQARVLAALARERADGFEAERDRAVELAAQAVRVARLAGDRQTVAFCLFAQHDVSWAPGTVGRRLAIATEMADAAGDDPELAFEAAFCRFIALVDGGDAALDVALRDMQRLADASRLPRQRFFVTSRQATLAIMRGEYALAIQHMEEADALGSMIGHPDTFGVRMTQLLMMGLAREGPAAVPRLVEEFGTVAPAEFEPEMRAYDALCKGQPATAAAIIRASEPAVQRARFRWRALSALAMDAEIVAAAQAVDLCERYYDDLLPYEDEVVDIGGATAVLGSVSFFLGLLAHTSGRPEPAGRHLQRALEVARRMGAGPLVTRIEGMVEASAVFRRDGGVWTLAFAGTSVNVADAKGLHDLASLLASPGADVPVLRLLAGAAAEPFGSDERLDQTARAAYRRRLAELDDALDAAALGNDDRRVQVLGAERDALVAELSAAAGLGGRARRLGDPGERARTTVTARIRDAVRKIEQVHPALGAHLRESVVTGRLCRYEPASPVRWRL
jgi:tetratricopeptide (TPR) repeat protein